LRRIDRSRAQTQILHYKYICGSQRTTTLGYNLMDIDRWVEKRVTLNVRRNRTRLSEQNCIVEWSLTSEKEYSDPFNEVEVSAVFDEPGGGEKIVPAFWAGGNVWRVRYASHKIGEHHFRTLCSDTSNSSLHGIEGSLEVSTYKDRSIWLPRHRGSLRLRLMLVQEEFGIHLNIICNACMGRRCLCRKRQKGVTL